MAVEGYPCDARLGLFRGGRALRKVSLRSPVWCAKVDVSERGRGCLAVAKIRVAVVWCAVVAALLLCAPGAFGAIYVVDTAADVNTPALNCAAAPLDCSLRDALNNAAVNPGADIIQFNIGGGGPQTITVSNTLGELP